eukprot:4742541-Amphidinium_carterae.1
MSKMTKLTASFTSKPHLPTTFMAWMLGNRKCFAVLSETITLERVSALLRLHSCDENTTCVGTIKGPD